MPLLRRTIGAVLRRFVRNFTALIFAGGLFHGAFVTDVGMAKVDLQGRASQTARFFLDDKRLRHQITEIGLRQVADVSEGVTTVVDGRLRYDSALFPTPTIKFRNYSKEVREDEGFEADTRQVYVDWLTENWAMKIGRIQFDWMESLSPRTSDAVTALDLRYGGFDNAAQIIEPVEAFSANSSVGFGSVEFMLVPRGKHHRLPKGENGYGYREKVNGLLDGVSRVLIASGLEGTVKQRLVSGEIRRGVNEGEVGARFLSSAGGVDFSAFAWRGHQRTPSLDLTLVESVGSGEQSPLWELDVTENFPRMNSYGAFASYGGDAFVLRVFSLYEPRRAPSLVVESELASILVLASGDTSQFLGDSSYRRGAIEDRLRSGGGFDYVFSKHLKLYSEGYATASRVTGKSVAGTELDETAWDYTGTLRLTNESFEDWFISCDSTVTGPERSWLINPDVTLAWGGSENSDNSGNSWKISVGGWFIESDSEKSALRILRGARQAYMRLATWF